jgi:hypothetical protein
MFEMQKYGFTGYRWSEGIDKSIYVARINTFRNGVDN